jgi:hypothetical protein
MPRGSTLLTCNAGAHAMRQLYLQLYLLLSHAYSRDGVHAMRPICLRLGRRARHAAALLTPITCLQARAQHATALRTCMPALHAMRQVYLLVSHACRRDGVHAMRTQHVCAARRLAQVLAVRRKYL